MLLPLCANAGMFLGPLIGGLLSSQPDMIRAGSHPYLPPNLLIACMYLVAAIGVFFVLDETLVTYRSERSIVRGVWQWVRSVTVDRDSSSRSSYKYAAVNTESPVSPTTPHSLDHRDGALGQDSAPSGAVTASGNKPAFLRIWTFNVCCTMLAHFIIAGHLGTFSTLWAVFLSTPVSDEPSSTTDQNPLKFSGGLGLQPRTVGVIMSALSALVVALQVLLYPRANDRLGTLRVWHYALYLFPVAYFLAPFPALVASRHPPDSQPHSAPAARPEYAAVALVLVVFGLGKTGVTPATTLLINDCTPHPGVRATVHATATVLGNLARSGVPVVALGVFGVGLRVGVVGVGFWALMGVAALACVAGRWVRDGSGEER